MTRDLGDALWSVAPFSKKDHSHKEHEKRTGIPADPPLEGHNLQDHIKKEGMSL